MQTEIIRIRHYGAPDVLQVEEQQLSEPGSCELLIRQTAIGVNYHDVYVRSGLYKTLSLPGIPGIEAAGVVEAIGSDVQGFAPGDRVGYVTSEYGAYAQLRLLPAAQALILPDWLDDVAVAGSLLKALTTCVLLNKAHQVEEGDTILVHAAAGGVGQMLCRWAKSIGANVIGTVGNRKKASVALNAGAGHVILYREENFVDHVFDLTKGKGVSAVFDSVGEDTFLGSLKCLDYEGKLICFGQASGPISPFPPSLLATRSNALCRPIIFHYLRSRASADQLARTTFEAFQAGMIRPLDAATLPLSDAAEAHQMLENRASPGAVILIP